MGAEKLGVVVDQDILDLDLGEETARRYMEIRRGARSMVVEASKSEEGMEKLGQVMAFLNDDIEHNKEKFPKK